jgi:hypothetical protein
VDRSSRELFVSTPERASTLLERESAASKDTLVPDTFIPIHGSLIVNLDAICEMQNCGGAECVVVLHSGKELPLGEPTAAPLSVC